MDRKKNKQDQSLRQRVRADELFLITVFPLPSQQPRQPILNYRFSFMQYLFVSLFFLQAEQLIENMELHELIDPRIGDSYDTYELYLMARAAYSCIQRNPELRPSMGEVIVLPLAFAFPKKKSC